MISALVLIFQYVFDYKRVNLTKVEEFTEINYVSSVKSALAGVVDANNDCSKLDPDIINAETFLKNQLLIKGITLNISHTIISCPSPRVSFNMNITTSIFFSHSEFIIPNIAIYTFANPTPQTRIFFGALGVSSPRLPANPDTGSDITLSASNAAAFSDNIRVDSFSGGPVLTWYNFRFFIDKPRLLINRLDTLWEGYSYTMVGAPCSQAITTYQSDLYIWNFTLSNWSLIGVHTNSVDTNLTRTFQGSEINNYLNSSGYIFLLIATPTPPVYSCDNGDHQLTDFVKIEATIKD